MSTVILVRPGATDFDEQHRIQGRLDLPLNERGEDELEQTLSRLEPLDIDAVYISPSNPARSTGESIAEHLGRPIKELDGLANMNLGLWQGLSFEDLRRKSPKVCKQWEDSPETICPPEGETVADVLARVQKALQKPMKKKATIAVVASEPLATLVAAAVRGTESIQDCPIVSNPKQPLVEVIDPEAPPTVAPVGKDEFGDNISGDCDQTARVGATTSAKGEDIG